MTCFCGKLNKCIQYGVICPVCLTECRVKRPKITESILRIREAYHNLHQFCRFTSVNNTLVDQIIVHHLNTLLTSPFVDDFCGRWQVKISRNLNNLGN